MFAGKRDVEPFGRCIDWICQTCRQRQMYEISTALNATIGNVSSMITQVTGVHTVWFSYAQNVRMRPIIPYIANS